MLATRVDTDLDDLANVLRREARLLTVAEVALGAATDDALRCLRREDLHRALIAADLGVALDLGPEPGLNDLVAAVPERWAAALAAHRARLLASPTLPPSLRDFLES